MVVEEEERLSRSADIYIARDVMASPETLDIAVKIEGPALIE